jgi:serine protease
MKRFSVFMTVFIVFGLVFSFGQGQGPLTTKGKPAFVPGEVIVKFADGAAESVKEGIRGRYGLTKVAESWKKGAFTVYRHGNPNAILNKLGGESGVVYAERNGIAYATMAPNDPLYSPYQWHMTRIGMEAAWDISTGSSNVVVAVCDTGVKESLEDLANTNFTPGWNFIRNKADTNDDNGHGSHVTGTVAQSTNNNLGVAGIAFNTTIMPVKVLDRRGSGSYTAIANGITFAVDNGAHIINLSLTGPSNSSTLENAVNYAWNNNVLLVCAAGNDNSSSSYYPAAYANSISVSATSISDTRASYSNYGSTIDICAPGGDDGDLNGDGYVDYVLQNTFFRRDEGYYFFSGTSMAAPHVAGVAALIKSVDFSLTNAQIRSILEGTAEDLGPAGWDQDFGHGIVDAVAALQAAQL